MSTGKRNSPLNTLPPVAAKEKISKWSLLLRNPWTWLVAAGFAILIVRSEVATLVVRLSRDEGAFLTIAQEILHGRVPYQDAFDHKAPGIYYVMAGSLVLTSHFSLLVQVLTARLLVVLASVLTALGIVLLGWRWWRLEIGIIAAALWLSILPLYEGNYALTEPFAAASTIWAVVVITGRPRMRAFFGAGFLLALGTLFKQTSILVLPGMIFLVLAPTRRGIAWRLTSTQWAGLGMLMAGLVLPWLMVMAGFAAVGALQSMLNQVLLVNLHYPSDPFPLIRSGLLAAAQAMPLVTLLPLMVVCFGLLWWLGSPFWARHIPSIGAAALAIIASLNMLPFVSHAYYHYWLSVVPWTALLAGLGILSLYDWARTGLERVSFIAVFRFGKSKRGVLEVLLLVLVAGLLLSNAWGTRTTFSSRHAFLPPQVAIGSWIAQNVPPDARLLIAPAEPEYYYLSQRLPAAPYVYLLPVNLSPALLDEVSAQIRGQQFDRVVWYDTYESNASRPAYIEIYQVLITHYHRVASYSTTLPDAVLGLTIYVPDHL